MTITKLQTTVLFLLLIGWFAPELYAQQRPFITTWETSVAEDSIIIPIDEEVAANHPYNYTVNWGDGTTESGFTGNAVHYYDQAGTYVVEITGQMPNLSLYNTWRNLDNNSKIKSIDQWGDIEWQSMRRMFYRCDNLINKATDVPDLSRVTSLSNMFAGCEMFTGGVSNWDVSNVTDFSGLFYDSDFQGDVSGWNMSNATNISIIFAFIDNFNGDVSGWDVSKVTNISGVFYSCKSFNGDISNWQVGNATNMFRTFSGASSFNGDISDWDVSKVTNMRSLFRGAAAFSGDLSKWDVSSVLSMEDMFWGRKNFTVTGLDQWNTASLRNMAGIFFGVDNFNEDISGWDVSQVTDMSEAFYATSFNRDISGWDVSQVTNMAEMFNNSPFNQDISGWDVSKVTNMAEMFRYGQFNQDISSWDIGLVTDMSDMFYRNSNWSTENYDNILAKWSLQDTQEGVVFGGGDTQYCSGGFARQTLIDKGWVFTDGGKASECTEVRYGVAQREINCLDSTYFAPSGKIVKKAGVINDTIPSSTANIDSVIFITVSMPSCVRYGATNIDLSCAAPVYAAPSGKAISLEGVYQDTIASVDPGIDSVITITATISIVSEYAQDSIKQQDIDVGQSLSLLANTSYTSFAQFQKSDKDWIELNSIVDDLVNTNRSAFMWMRQSTRVTSSESFQILLGINTSGSGTVSNLMIRSNEELAIYDGGSFRNSGVVVTDGEWHHVGYTYNEGSNLTTIYVDGEPVRTYTNGQSISATSRISIGQEFDNSARSNFFQGEITEVSIWNEELTKEDVNMIMSQKVDSSHPKYANMKGYYPMVTDCGEASTTVVKDYSGNGNNGTAYSDLTAVTEIHNQDSLSQISGFNSQGWYTKAWVFDGSRVVSKDKVWETAAPITGEGVLVMSYSSFVIRDTFDIAVANQVIWNGRKWIPTAPSPSNDVVLKGEYNSDEQGSLVCANLYLQPGSSFELKEGQELTISGNFVNSGNFSQTGGKVVFSGDNAQTISGENTTSFTQVEVDNTAGLTLNSEVEVKEKLLLTGGEVTTNGNLMLRSTQDYTAYVVVDGGTTSGSVVVERMARSNNDDLGIYSGIGRRFMSAPTSNATVGAISNFTPNLSGAATYNTDGAGSLTAENFPNIFSYDESRIGAGAPFSKGWKAPTAASDALTAGLGFKLEMTAGAVINFSGPLNTGQIDVVTNNSGEANSGWSLLGNPYPSPINLKNFVQDADNSHLFGTIFVRYPTQQYNGAWGSYIAASGVMSPSGIVINGALSPMQAFMVYAATSGTVSFKDSHRTDPAGFNVLRTESAGHEGLIRLKLKKKEQFDEVVVYLHEAASSHFDPNYDARMLNYGSNNNLLLQSGKELLKINAVSPHKELVQPLSVWIANSGTQSFELSEMANWNSEMVAYLEDRASGELIELTEGVSYDFTAVQGWQQNRFFLHLRTLNATLVDKEELSNAGLALFTYGRTIAVNTQTSDYMNLTVYSISGVELQQESFKGSQRIQTSLPTGIYLLRLETAEGVFVKRVKL